MAYTIISQNNTTTTLQDENGNIIYVPGRVTLATSTDYTITEVNNNTATLTDGSGNVIRDVPCVVVLAGGGGGGDSHNKGYYATPEALAEAEPTAQAGDWAIVGSTDTVWLWDTDNEEWVDSDQKGQVTSVNGQTGAVIIPNELPSQTGHSGEFLTTDGTDASWAAVDALPSQTGQSGKFLTTDGTDASWSDKPLVNQTNFGIAVSSSKMSNTFVSYYAPIIYTMGSVSGYVANSAQTLIGTINPVGGGLSGWGATVLGQSCSAKGSRTIAIGAFSQATADGAIQLNSTGGYTTNSDANTFKVANANGNFEIMSADGTIPTARLMKVNTTVTLAVADWSSNTQTVNVTGMTADGVVMVSPDPTDQSAYTSAGIICSAQAAGTLTFTCSTTPTADLSVNVVML